MAGTYVEGHSPALGGADPAAVEAAQAAHAAGEQAALDRRGHYHQNVLGQGAQAGDPMPAESSLQSFVPDVPGEGKVDAVMDERQEWEADRNRVVREQAIARAEAVERAADEARRADTEARRDALWDAARRTGQPVPTHGDILARARGMFEVTEDGRDDGAAYGSQSRPAQFVVLADGSRVEMTARPPVARSASEAYDDHLLEQAKRSSEDTFMRVQISRFHARRAHQAEAERTVARRQLERELGYDEISR